MKEIKFEKVSYYNKGIIPTRADDGSAGHDFYTPVDFVIKPGEIFKFETGIKCKMPKNVVLTLYPRSSIGIKNNLMLCNSVGVIDASFYNNENNEGNISCALFNYGNKEISFKRGDRIFQGLFTEYFVANNSEVLSATRNGGIGSTGV